MNTLYLLFGNKFTMCVVKGSTLALVKELEYSSAGFGAVADTIKKLNIDKMYVLYPGVLADRKFSNTLVAGVFFDKLLQYPEADIKFLKSLNVETYIVDVCALFSAFPKDKIQNAYFKSSGFVSCYYIKDGIVTNSFRCIPSMLETRLQNIDDAIDISKQGNKLSCLYFNNSKALAYCTNNIECEAEIIGQMQNATEFVFPLDDLLNEPKVEYKDEQPLVIEESHDNVPIKTPDGIQKRLKRRARKKAANVISALGFILIIPSFISMVISTFTSDYSSQQLNKEILNAGNTYIANENTYISTILNEISGLGVSAENIVAMNQSENYVDFTLSEEINLNGSYSNVSEIKDESNKTHLVVVN